MSSLYISTSRKPGKNTRQLAKWLSIILNAEYENRGKKSLSETRERAEFHGRKRILFIYEKKGNPYSINFFEKDWIYPEILVKSVEFPEERKERIKNPGEVKIVCEDSVGKKIAELFNIQNEPEAGVEMHLSSKEISFKQNEQPIGPKIKLIGLKEKKGLLQ